MTKAFRQEIHTAALCDYSVIDNPSWFEKNFDYAMVTSLSR